METPKVEYRTAKEYPNLRRIQVVFNLDDPLQEQMYWYVQNMRNRSAFMKGILQQSRLDLFMPVKKEVELDPDDFF